MKMKKKMSYKKLWLMLVEKEISPATLRKDLNIANWGRKLAEIEFMKAEKRMIPLLCTTASQRYERLLQDHPQLLRRVPLECLASYLGVTPVSLSRIRAKIK